MDWACLVRWEQAGLSLVFFLSGSVLHVLWLLSNYISLHLPTSSSSCCPIFLKNEKLPFFLCSSCIMEMLKILGTGVFYFLWAVFIGKDYSLLVEFLFFNDCSFCAVQLHPMLSAVTASVVVRVRNLPMNSAATLKRIKGQMKLFLSFYYKYSIYSNLPYQ